MSRTKRDSLSAAVEAGYKVSSPMYLTAQEENLCKRLGPEFHPARLGVWNIAHRVIGDGWSAAVYPTASGREFYVVELWRGYCTECAARVHGVEYGDIKPVLARLERRCIHGDQVENDWNPLWTVWESDMDAFSSCRKLPNETRV